MYSKDLVVNVTLLKSNSYW